MKIMIPPFTPQVSVVRFASDADVLWYLDSQETATRERLEDELQSISHVKGNTYTSEALDLIVDEVLGGSGDR